MLYLKRFNKEDMKKQYEFVKELKSENGYQNDYYGMTYEEFLPMYEKRENHRKGINLPDGFVADSQFFLYNDDEIVGVFNLRHKLNDFLRTGPGHIGYCIGSNYRGKGYASCGIALLLKELDEIEDFNDEEVYMSCHVTNLASLKAQLKNGAYLVDIKNDHFLTRILL